MPKPSPSTPRPQPPRRQRLTAAPQAPAEATALVTRWSADGAWCAVEDAVSVEAPLEIVLQADDGAAEVFSVTMRTPGDERALALGLLLAESVIASPAALRDLHLCAHNPHRVRAHLAAPHLPDLSHLRRHLPVQASCGLCGKTTADLPAPPSLPDPHDAPTVAAATVAALPDALRRAQAQFSRTGGLHAAALFSLDGRLLDLREDVGRHNALDKLLGHQALQGVWPLPPLLLLLSGRVSYELIQKALSARLPLVAAIGAPSSLAIDTAARAGLTLIGFTRPDRLNVYTHPARVLP